MTTNPLRLRFMDPSTGRFTTLDPFAGDMQDPLSLNKYLYTQADPINGADPTGQYDEGGHFWTTYMVALAVHQSVTQTDRDAAFKLAYYSQLPDEDPAYEAITVFNKSLGSEGVLWSDWRYQVFYYLHALTGGTTDTAKRNQNALAQLVTNTASPVWERGFLIHALADSYSHVDRAGRPFGPWIGHGLAGHAPDFTNTNWNNFGAYVLALYRALGGQDPENNTRLWYVIKAGSRKGSDQTLEAVAKTSQFGYPYTYVPGADIGQKGAMIDEAGFESPSPWDVENTLFPLIAKAYGEPLLHDPGEATFIRLFGHQPGDPIQPAQGLGGGDIFDEMADL